MALNIIMERFCRKCGKNFVPAPYHIYKDGKGMYCSWTCYNHRKDGGTRKQTIRKPRVQKRVGQYTLDGNPVLDTTTDTCGDAVFVRKVFSSAVEAADSVNGCADSIRHACRDGKPFRGFIWKYEERTEDT